MTEWIERLRRLPALGAQSYGFAGAGFLFCFLLAGAGGHIAPLGAAGGCAFWMAGYPFCAMLGGLAGALVFQSYQQALVLAALLPAAWLLQKRPRPPETADRLLLLCAAWGVTFPLFNMASFPDLMNGFANMSLSTGGALCLFGAVRGVKRMLRKRCPDGNEQLCFCGSAALLVLALCRFQPGDFSVAMCAACFLSLCAAYGNGILCVAVAMLLAAACVLGGAPLALAGCLGLCALCAAAARPLGKWGLGAGFFACALMVYTFISPALSPLPALVACGVFCCLPVRYLRVLHMDAPDRALEQAEATLAGLRVQLANASGVLREAAPLFAGEDGFAMRQVAAVSEALGGMAREVDKPRRRYHVDVGAAALPKAGSRETGDSMGLREVRGRLLVLLSDGMGSGAEAHRESAAAVALLGDLLSIGFGLPEALECVNRMLMQRVNSGDMFATMDALLVDLADANAQFIKYGAPPSYILRAGKVHTLYAEALPAGILKEAQPALHVTALHRGDAVVLMTDGALEALGGDLTRAILENAERTPDEAAQAILCLARQKSGADDMTVIVARIA